MELSPSWLVVSGSLVLSVPLHLVSRWGQVGLARSFCLMVHGRIESLWLEHLPQQGVKHRCHIPTSMVFHRSIPSLWFCSPIEHWLVFWLNTPLCCRVSSSGLPWWFGWWPQLDYWISGGRLEHRASVCQCFLLTLGFSYSWVVSCCSWWWLLMPRILTWGCDIEIWWFWGL